MRLFVKVLAAIVALTFVSAIGLLLYLVFADLGKYKTDIEEGVLDATGFELGIGEFDLEVGGQTVLTAARIVVDNPEYPDAARMASVGRLHVVIDTWSLLTDKFDVEAFELEDVEIALHQREDGRANWQATPRQPQIPLAEENMKQSELILHAANLANVNVSYEVSGEAPFGVRLDSLALDRQLDGSMHYDVYGRLNVIPADTLIGNLLSQPFELSADVASLPSGFDLNNLDLSFGESELAGSTSLRFDGERPSVWADISSSRIDLRSPEGEGEAARGDVETRAGPPGLVFSDTPLATSALDVADIEADITVETVLLDTDTLTGVGARVSLEDGALGIDPLEFRDRDGEFSGQMFLRPDGESHSLDIDLQARNLRVGALRAEGQDPATIPPLDARLVLTGQGDSLHAIIAGANGSLKGSQQSGQIDLQAAGVLFSDLVTSILRAINPMTETQTTTNLECGIYDINIADGVATIERLALQSDRLTIISSGSIDLDTEEIDMTLRTKTREGFGVSLGGVVNSFLKLGGTLSAPSVGVDAAGSATTTGAAIMTGGLSVLAKGLFDRVSAEADLCAALQAAEAEAAPVE